MLRLGGSWVVLCAALAYGCGGDDSKATGGNEDAGPSPSVEAGLTDATTMPVADAGAADAGAADGGLIPCLDTPGSLPRPPENRLPCDLLPPGFGR